VSRQQPHPRAGTTDLRAVALLAVRRVYGELVRLLGHEDQLTVRVWEAIGAEKARVKIEDEP
jgi:hypothetical protein